MYWIRQGRGIDYFSIPEGPIDTVLKSQNYTCEVYFSIPEGPIDTPELASLPMYPPVLFNTRRSD